MHQDNGAGLEDYLTMVQNDHDPLRIAQILLDRGAKTDGILHELVHALYWGDYEKNLIKFLQSYGCDINAKSRRKTPLMTLVMSYKYYTQNKDSYLPRKEVMEFLLSCGASTEEIYTDKLLTPMHWAVRHSHLRIVELLLNHDAYPNPTHAKGRTPLHLASFTQTSSLMNRKLINKGTDINVDDMFNRTPVLYTLPSLIHFNVLLEHSAV